jgi:hypothetical protein
LNRTPAFLRDYSGANGTRVALRNPCQTITRRPEGKDGMLLHTTTNDVWLHNGRLPLLAAGGGPSGRVVSCLDSLFHLEPDGPRGRRGLRELSAEAGFRDVRQPVRATPLPAVLVVSRTANPAHKGRLSRAA